MGEAWLRGQQGRTGDLPQPSLYKRVTAQARAQGLRYVQCVKPSHIRHMP